MSPLESNRYDVIICGGGLAGLTLARQLTRQQPGVSVAVVERLSRPHPAGTHKVGESVLAPGGAYVTEVLGLRDYLSNTHIEKLGLRFFFGDSDAPFHKRPEFGRSDYVQGLDEWQLDRGRLENDLCQMNKADGVDLLEGTTIDAIHIEPGIRDHRVDCTTGSGKVVQLSGRWLIDATGRRRMLQRQLNLSRPNDGKCSAAWFRVKGRIDVADWVDSAQTAWHDRVVGRQRYRSTNHLMGEGYWVWLIPLSSGHTSIGIVAHEDLHPFEGYNTYPRALDWLTEREPRLASALGNTPPADFLVMRRYCLSSERVISADRWACTGESGCFMDPFYSHGTDAIAYMNSLICDAVRLDFKEPAKLTNALCEARSQDFIAYSEELTATLQSAYPYFGDTQIATCKIAWHFSWGIGHFVPLFAGILFRPGFLEVHSSVAIPEDSNALNRAVYRLFTQWSQSETRAHRTYEWIEYFSMPFLGGIAQTSLNPAAIQTPADVDKLWSANRRVLEELALAIFFLAVEDVMPSRVEALHSHGWLNAWKISLNPEQWEADGLFDPTTPKGDYMQHLTHLQGRFHRTGTAMDIADADTGVRHK